MYLTTFDKKLSMFKTAADYKQILTAHEERLFCSNLQALSMIKIDRLLLKLCGKNLMLDRTEVVV